MIKVDKENVQADGDPILLLSEYVMISKFLLEELGKELGVTSYKELAQLLDIVQRESTEELYEFYNKSKNG